MSSSGCCRPWRTRRPEFTHESFGEYLAAEYLAAVCHRLVEEGKDDLGQPVPRVSRQEGCREWLRAFGPAFVPDPVEEHLAPMLRGFPQFLGGGEADARVVERLRGRAGELVRSLLDESEAEEAVTVARAWGLRPTQVLGLALANAVAVAGLRFGDEGYRFDPETVAPGRFWELCRTVELAVRRTPGTALRTFSRMGVSTAALDPHGGVGWHGAFLPFVRLRGPLTVALRGAFLQGCDLECVVAQGVDLGGVTPTCGARSSTRGHRPSPHAHEPLVRLSAPTATGIARGGGSRHRHRERPGAAEAQSGWRSGPRCTLSQRRPLQSPPSGRARSARTGRWPPWTGGSS